ncbi:ATP-binding protein [Comamonas terrigena]|uniref:ATP-binding protein n=1 Tax=Comamonas terrigena TaxID=32013 RepID=UPI00244946FD|nr:ATP-binding protein [Comamonas terrigena]MDH1701536.1 ATP-binding protein [Comamonas terrigena]
MKRLRRSPAPTSLRLRLVLGLSLTLCVLWGSVAAWMFPTMQRELRTMLDDRLIASARMVAGIVHQFQPAQVDAITPANNALLSVIARDGVACEVSLVRSEVDILPLAKTSNSPDFTPLTRSGFGRIEKGGKSWRTYVLEENGIRIATADRLDVREQLVQSFVYTLVVPFVLALAGVVLLTWWICTLGLEPLRRLGDELQHRPPQDPSPVQTGQDTAELAPLVGSLNQLLGRMNRAIEHERRWTADAAHELRTPLTAIKTHVQVAQLVLERHAPPGPGSPGNPAGQALKQASEGIDHMHATLEQLLQLARVESASAGTAPSTQGDDITEALHLACRQSLQRAGKGGAPTPRLQTGLEPDALHGWELPLAPALLTCAITNLVDNALRHHLGEQPITLQLSLQPASTGTAGDTDGTEGGQGPAHGTTSHGTAGTTWMEACASTASAPATLQIQVRDHGPGLSAEECAQALQRFWRKTSATQGSGLGLTIVQRIAESAGGQLHLAPSAPGLVATLSLPLQRVAHSAA